MSTPDPAAIGDAWEGPRPLVTGMPVVIGATVVAVILLTLLASLMRQPDLVARLSQHFTAVMAGTLAPDVPLSEPDRLAAALRAAGLPFTPRIPSLEPDFHLLGGRLNRVDDRPTGVWMYRSTAADMLLVEAFDAQLAQLGASDERRTDRSPELHLYRKTTQTVVCWQDGSLVYALVSTLPTEQVVALARRATTSYPVRACEVRGHRMASTIRWGLLSTARINRALIPPIKSLPRHTLRAVASRDAARAAAYAAEWEIPVAYGSYDALLADPEIDAVYNPLPNALHAEWTIRAARAGKHVLCEKPLALSVAEVNRIAEAAARADVVVTEAFMYRHHPQTLRLKALIDDGAIGEVLVIRGAFTFTLSRPGDVRLEVGMGGGSLWDVGCYPVSMARYLAGREPVRVVGWQRAAPSGIDDVFVGMLDFGCTLALFDCGFAAPFRTDVEIVGTTGAVAVPVPFKPGDREQVIVTRNGDREIVPVDGQALYVGEVEDLADAILHGTAPRISLADSRANTAAIVALYESARSGRAVALG